MTARWMVVSALLLVPCAFGVGVLVGRWIECRKQAALRALWRERGG
jgi:hypothetical protein